MAINPWMINFTQAGWLGNDIFKKYDSSFGIGISGLDNVK